jgi:protein-S-isoprenylcysteine O-methyltransferase Ste14
MKEKNGEHPFGDAGQLLLLALFLLIWIADSFILNYSTFLAAQIPLLIRLIVFSILFGISLYLFKSGHVVVSHDHKPTEVVSRGAFHFVRHPLYLASILTYLCLANLTFSIISFVLIFGIFIFYNYIAGYEERLLLEKYGDAYRQYQQKTGKWFPRFAK